MKKKTRWKFEYSWFWHKGVNICVVIFIWNLVYEKVDNLFELELLVATAFFVSGNADYRADTVIEYRYYRMSENRRRETSV